MAKFGKKSKKELKTLDLKLQKIFNMAIKITDFSILEGRRSPERQRELLAEGKTQVVISKHNVDPSQAGDIAPYPVDWENIESFAHLIGIIKGIALALGIKIRCGYDWKSFKDCPHVELVE